MALIVKMMGGEDCPDEDARKTFSLKSGVFDVIFTRNDGIPTIELNYGPPEYLIESYGVFGNVYVMNENGKTVASFGCAPIADPKGPGRHYGELSTYMRDTGPIPIDEATDEELIGAWRLMKPQPLPDFLTPAVRESLQASDARVLGPSRAAIQAEAARRGLSL